MSWGQFLTSLEVAIRDDDHEKLRRILIQAAPEIMDVLYEEAY